MAERSTLEAALAYLARGWGVVPLWPVVERNGALVCSCKDGEACGKHTGKHPGVPAVERFDDAARVRALWDAARRNNGAEPGVAVATGGGLVVIDVDPRHGGDASWDALVAGRESEVETYAVKTGSGGAHYYFTCARRVPNSSSRVAPGIDVRGEGGYVVAPPTLHESGARYELLDARPLRPLPSWLFDAACARVRPARIARARRDGGAGALGAQVSVPDSIPEGSRKDTLMRAGCSLRARGLDADAIADALLLLNAGRCAPPLAEGEVEELARDLCQRYPAGRSAAAESIVEAGERAAALAERSYRFKPDPAPYDGPDVPEVPEGFPDPWEGWEGEGGEGGGASGAQGTGAPREGEQAAPPAGGAEGTAPARAGVPSRDPATEGGEPAAPLSVVGVGRRGYVDGSGPVATDAGGELAPLPRSVWEERAEERAASGTYPGGDGWEDELHRNGDGGVTKGVRNLVLILRNDRRICGGALLRFNSMSLFPELGSRPVTDSDVSHLRAEIERHWHMKPGKDLTQEAIRVTAELEPFDPRREYLARLRWDGRERIPTFAERHFGARCDLYGAFMAKFFVGAVKRVFEPGCKLDTVLTLLGPQGYRKSTTFRVLFGEWFSDSMVEPGTREGMLAAAAAWGIELGEVEALTLTREDSALKRFISSPVDTFRRPYAAALEAVPRHSVFVATTNERNFLRDLTGTGSRRWHVVELFRRVDAGELAAERDALWAEAVMRYRRGEATWLSDADEAVREELAAEYYQGDPWDDAVPAWCSQATNLRPVVTEADGARWAASSAALLTRACGLDARDLTTTNQRRLAGVMAKLGAKRSKQRFEYGNPPRLAATAERCFLLPPEWKASGKLATEALQPAWDDPVG
ncbi:MAG: VapE family protein [Polyangiales bacterium]